MNAFSPGDPRVSLSRGLSTPGSPVGLRTRPMGERPNLRIFDETARWDEPLDALQLARIRFTLSRIPEDVRSVLDVGCGRGDLAHRMSQGLFVAGCDLSGKGLAQVRVPRVRARVSSLPFVSGSFDLVLCAEVLEHLPGDEVGATLDEVCRVSRRYVLVTVPYCEDLSRMRARCGACGALFHAYGHLSSFSEESLKALHPALRLLSCDLLLRRRRAIRSWIQVLRRRLCGLYETHPNMVCPGCGNQDFSSGLLAYAARKLSGLVNRLSLPGTVSEGWIAALYAVGGSAP